MDYSKKAPICTDFPELLARPCYIETLMRSNFWSGTQVTMTREEQIQYIAGLSHMALLTYVPLWAHEVGLSDPEVAIVAITYGLVIFASNIIAGRLSDLIGSRKLFILIGLAFSFPSVLLLIFPRDALSFLVIA